MSDPARVSAEADRDALARLLAAVSPAQLAAVARDLFAYVPLPSGFSWEDRRAVVERVASLSASPSAVPPLVAYATRLSHEAEQLDAMRLSQWADVAGRASGMSEESLRRLYAESLQGDRSADPPVSAKSGLYDSDKMLKSDVESRSEDPPLPNQMITTADLPKASLERSDAVRIWGGVPLRNPDFTGRETLLLVLQRSLETRSKASVLPNVLHGFGGVGKTQLAVEFAYRFADRYDLVWWIPAEQQLGVLQSLADLGRQLGIPVTQDLSQAASLVLDALSSTRLRWLLVYDNANEPDDLAHLIPSAGGHVILTSRNQTWSNVWDAIEVNVFAREESIALVRKRGTGISLEDADRLAEKMGDLPLALDQAASWQSATKMPVSEYLRLFDEHHRVLLTEGKPTGYPTPIAALVKLAFERLQQDNSAVAQLLEMFAVFGAEPISIELLRRGKAADIPRPLGPALRDSIALGRIVRDLRKFGLAKVDIENRIQVHRLFQLVLRDELGAEQLRQSRLNVHRLLGAAHPGEPDDDTNHRGHAEIAPHVLAAHLIEADEEETLQVVLDQIRYLHVIGDYEGSRRLGEVAVRAWQSRTDHPGLGPDGELTIVASRHLANALLSLGINDRALELASNALQRLRENPQFGWDHEHTLYTADVVAAVQRVAGEFTVALEIDRDNVERHERVFGAEDWQTLRCTGNLAVNQRMLSNFQEAYDLDAKVVRTLEESVTGQNRRLLFSQSNLARDLYGLGRYADALTLQSRILPTYRRIMSNPKHPDLLLASRTQAIALRKTGQFDEALRVARENYYDCSARYGESHQHSLAATMTYANTLRVTGELGQARGLALDAINRYRRIFGEKHPLTSVALVNTAVILRAMNDVDRAREMDESAYATMAAALGAGHGYTLCAANGLANDAAQAGNVAEARRISGETLAVSRQNRGEAHPYTLLCAVNAGFDLVAAGETEEGQQALSAAVSALSGVLGPDHPEALDARRGKRAECDIEPPPT